MRHFFLLALFLALVSVSVGQTTNASFTPSAPKENIRTTSLGTSLEKFGKKKRRDSQPKQNDHRPDYEDIIRVKTDLVDNAVLVTNQKGNVVLGLQKDDFIVRDDGVPQRIEIFSFDGNAPLPRSIVLIIDCAPPQFPYLKQSVEAAKVLVDKLAPQDEMAIVTVNLKRRLDFTQDKTVLKKALDALEAKWDYNIEIDTLLAVLNEMFQEQDRQRIVIFQGDGTEIIWLKQDKEHPYRVSYSTLYKSGMKWTGEKSIRAFGFADVREAIERSKATIYSVIPGTRFLGLSKDEQLARAKTTLSELNKSFGGKEKELPAIIRELQSAEVERKMAGQTAMFKVAELSGGFADYLERPEDAENVYSNIFTVIKNRYVIGYYPTNQERDGKRREVKIEVRNHPEYVVTERKAYFLSE